MEFVIVTGLSGAGKSQAIKVMEDIGFYCMDNLPPSLLPKFAELCYQSMGKVKRVALVVDIRGGEFFDDLFENLSKLKDYGYNYKIMFLDASNEVLIKRYKELRRPHPLSPDGQIIDGISKERDILTEIRQKSDYLIDTTNYTIGNLKEKIKSLFLEGEKKDNFTISVVSFGFKHGIPLDADLVFDVRFLPNPHYIDELREFTGNDKRVRDYVMNWDQSKEFLNKLNDMISFLIPFYIKEGKSQLIVAIGCTGGKHRSVTIANELFHYLKNNKFKGMIKHRDSNINIKKGSNEN
ncbi:RNase adapter RapZ [Clostridium sp. D2Q-11]|uniref:RNase adapter RapZ n=1 Tax=Anaeromonas frigoriresistens TaxID=2683708 RepID=A0A942UVX7_9FIRM|nr:RNase adapter RapZ [Anaeromonas frigoriresistens]MBS4537406.1 RNase adapter RapZ [Anaeromonas frigoriresistens]